MLRINNFQHHKVLVCPTIFFAILMNGDHIAMAVVMAIVLLTDVMP